MYKTIVRTVSIVLVFIGVLWFADSNLNKFSNDIDLKNPLDIFGIFLPEMTEPEINTPDISTSEKPKKETTKEEKEDKQKEIVVEKPKEETSKKEKDVKKSNLTEDELNKLISTIRVSSESQTEKYNRDDYEKPYEKYPYKGEKLSRNKYAWHISKHLVKENPFEYVCPYTGLTIYDYETLDFDHLIALNYVHKFGDVKWSNKEKNRYAYDIYIGVDVLNKSNRSKSDKGPSEWLPDTNIADYCYSWLVIASKYDIALRQVDINVCKLELLNAISSGQEIKMINQVNLDIKDITQF